MSNDTRISGEARLRQQLERLNEIGIALSSEKSVDRLMQMILRESRRFANAEAGTLYVVENDELVFSVVQNDRVQSQEHPGDQLPRIPIERSSLSGWVAATGQLLNIPDVYDLAGDVEYRFNVGFDQRSGYHTQSVLVLPMKQPDGRINGVIQLINALDDQGEVTHFEAALENMYKSLASQAAVALANAHLVEELHHTYEEMVMRLARAAEYHDNDTGNHIRRVAHFTRALALSVGVDERRAHQLFLAAPMHDIGKLAVPDSILKKPGKLTADERTTMERHTVYGGEILQESAVPLLRLSHEIALTHHERWDGTGYPNGLAGDAIPISGRITAIADVFDALTSKRCYKPPFSVESACDILVQGAGSHFDPGLVDKFMELMPKIDRIRAQFPDDDD